MRVRRLEITRFRGLRHAVLHPGHRNVLIGPNNAGKSTYLEALDLALHPGLGRGRRGPDELDYFARRPDRGFEIEVTLGDLDRGFSAEIKEHLEGWNNKGREVVAEVDGEEIEPVVRIRARGTDDFEVFHEFAKDESEGARVSRRLRRDIGWFYDGRTRDPAWQMTFHRGGALDRLFDVATLGPALEQVRAALGEGAEGFAGDEVVRGVLGDIGTDLHGLSLLAAELLPGFELGSVSPRELLLMLRLALPEREDGQPFQVPLSRQGRGVQRLLLVATLLRLARAENERPPIGAFEEPEEALEPTRQAQMADLIVGLAEARSQVFVVTHSPEIIRAFAVDDVVLISDEPRGQATPLGATLSMEARRGYERRLDGPIVRALFASVPVLVEGPGDRAVLGTFWDKLARQEQVRPRHASAVELVNCEGAGEQPKVAHLLCEAGKFVAAWIERDRTDTLDKARRGGHCAVIVLYARDGRCEQLEGALARAYPIEALAGAMAYIADSRGFEWDEQRTDLLSRCSDAGLSDEHKAAFRAATDVTGMLLALPEESARQLIREALAARGLKPFEIKSALPARLFAEELVRTNGVAAAFSSPIVALDRWALEGCAPSADIHMPFA